MPKEAWRLDAVYCCDWIWVYWNLEAWNAFSLDADHFIALFLEASNVYCW